ncbi:MAG: transcription-repair coupling factor [Candidatus Promineifilaceae bacterium]
MNLSGLLSLFDELPAYGQLLAELRAGRMPPPLGLLASARPPTLARLVVDLGRPALFVTGRVEQVPIWQQTLEAWLPAGVELLRFPEPTPLPYERGAWSDLSRQRRLGVLARLMAGQHPLLPADGRPFVVLSSARALLHKTLPRRRFVAATSALRAGQVVDLEKLTGRWQEAGYAPASVVEAAGQFSRRGGILDIYPLGARYPVRIELFGDEIETLRAFDPASQRSLSEPEQVEGVLVPPAREVLPGDTQAVGVELARAAGGSNGETPTWRDDVAALMSGAATPHLEFYLPMVYPQPASLLDYAPPDALLAVDDLAEFAAATAEFLSHARQSAGEQSGLPPDYPAPLFEWEQLAAKAADRGLLVLGQGEGAEAGEPSALAEHFQPGARYGGQMRPFLLELRRIQAAGERAVVVSRQAQRLAELWRSEPAGRNGLPQEQLKALPVPGSVAFVQGSLPGGFLVVRPASAAGDGRGGVHFLLNLLSDDEVFGWNRPVPRRRSAPRPIAPETYFADITPGDYVVQLEFGIGRFEGLVVRAIGGMEREYLKVSFANSDVLYVPVHHADRLSRWIGPDERPPAVHRLGERGWRRTKAKAQQAVNELADELLDLYAVRETIPGHAFAADSVWQSELEASFPYRETEDQLQAIAEVKADMERPHPMDRLICGDVGYGKTEVALRAAFKAVMDNRQVAILVPTTVLAQQHYDSFSERLQPFPVQVEMLSRFRTPAQQERILRGLRAGQVDIVIGTHRLLSDDVAFKDLGLLIIDEEQRFGVSHKERLKQLRTEVDVLTMTATPIPRTLYLGLTGARDISIIETAPAERLAVETYVGEEDNTLLRRAILRELDRGGQLFYVHNRVQTMDHAYLELGQLVPEATIAIAHGQMGERDLEEVMLRFVQGQVDILLCTTIIENGLDIPNANTLIVDRADQFGLAQLYQLRGRVGRSARRAHAYFFHPEWRRVTPDAQQRLEVIAAQNELGAGYSIAMRDLEIRGAGDILGARQSGHIAEVGFDLYTRLLAAAVKRRKAERAGLPIPIDPPEAVLIDLPLAAYLPTDYVPEAGLRLRLYRRMAVLDTLGEIDAMAAELADRFGPIPDPVDNLLYQLRVKVLASRAHIPAVTSELGQIQVRLAQADGFSHGRLQRKLGNDVRVSRTGIWLDRELTTREWQIALVQILERLRELAPGAGRLGQAEAAPTQVSGG